MPIYANHRQPTVVPAVRLNCSKLIDLIPNTNKTPANTVSMPTKTPTNTVSTPNTNKTPANTVSMPTKTPTTTVSTPTKTSARLQFHHVCHSQVGAIVLANANQRQPTPDNDRQCPSQAESHRSRAKDHRAMAAAEVLCFRRKCLFSQLPSCSITERLRCRSLAPPSSLPAASVQCVSSARRVLAPTSSSPRRLVRGRPASSSCALTPPGFGLSVEICRVALCGGLASGMTQWPSFQMCNMGRFNHA